MRKSPILSSPHEGEPSSTGAPVGAPAPPSPLGAIAGADAPPLRLPGSHFAVALLFLVLGSVGLVWVAPELAAGAYLSPRVAGVTHLFTLGWISTSIMGALYQLLPVALGREIRWLGLAETTLTVWVPGLLAFALGLAFHEPRGVILGATLVSTGVLLFSVNLGATLKGAPRKDVTWWALTAACFFLVLTMVVGAALAANLGWPFMGADRLTALVTHIHVALVGWVLMVMVGVGHRLLPMFLLSHGAPERWGKLSVALLTAGTLLLFALHHTSGPVARLLPAGLILGGAAAFLTQARAFYGTRRRPRLDTGMRMAAAGLVLVAAGAALGTWLVLTGFARPVLATAYVLTLILGISLFVAGHYYKIVPFLVWFHRFGPLAGRRPVPMVSDLYDARRANGAGLLLVTGAAALALSVALGAAVPARAAAILFTLGATLEAVQLAGVARRRPEPE